MTTKHDHYFLQGGLLFVLSNVLSRQTINAYACFVISIEKWLIGFRLFKTCLNVLYFHVALSLVSKRLPKHGQVWISETGIYSAQKAPIKSKTWTGLIGLIHVILLI